MLNLSRFTTKKQKQDSLTIKTRKLNHFGGNFIFTDSIKSLEKISHAISPANLVYLHYEYHT